MRALSTSFRFLLLAGLGLFLTACAADGDKDKPLPDKPMEELYNKGLSLMDEGEYSEAARQFEEVERQHPYSQWAARAELMTAYARYKGMDYDDAMTALDQFIKLHPGNPNVAYAYYLRALCSYERITDVRRDQSFAQNALRDLTDIVTRFPDTLYAKDAVLKISLVNDHMAGYEMEVGRFYLTQKVYTAAVGRFRTVIEKYQTTSHVPEALHRLVECDLALGLKEEARQVAAVLGHNFPGSTWYQDSYSLLVSNNITPLDEPDASSWVSRLWHGLF